MVYRLSERGAEVASDLQLVVVLLDGNNLHFQVDTQRQCLDGNARSGRLVDVEVLAVDTVELSELSGHVGQEDVGLDDVVQRRVGSFQDVGDVLDHLLGLLSNGGGTRQRLVLSSVWDLAGDVDETWALVMVVRVSITYR